jgi:hypothetical protein
MGCFITKPIQLGGTRNDTEPWDENLQRCAFLNTNPHAIAFNIIAPDTNEQPIVMKVPPYSMLLFSSAAKLSIASNSNFVSPKRALLLFLADGILPTTQSRKITEVPFLSFVCSFVRDAKIWFFLGNCMDKPFCCGYNGNARKSEGCHL